MEDKLVKCPRGNDCFQCRDLTPEELEMARRFWTDSQELLQELEVEE